MNRVVAVLNIGGRSVTRKSRESFQYAARRWGARYNEITKPLEPRRHHFWQKMLVHRLFGQHEHVLQLDGDMLIRADAPSPFLLVPPERLGVVRVNPGFGPWVRAREQAIQFWSSQLAVPPIDVFVDYINSGFMLYSGSSHGSLFDSVYEEGCRVGYSQRFLPEQTILSLRVHHDRLPVSWLPFLFNTCGVQRNPRAGVGPTMRTFIYHFSGVGKWALRQTDWRIVPSMAMMVQSLIVRLPTGPIRGAQLGVAQGILSATLLSHLPHLHLLMLGRWRGDRHVRATDPESIELQARGNLNYEIAFRETGFAAGRRVMKDALPSDAARPVEDRSLDFVLIGGLPMQGRLDQVVSMWKRKLKPRGFICGQLPTSRRPNAARAIANVARRTSSVFETDEGDAWFFRTRD